MKANHCNIIIQCITFTQLQKVSKAVARRQSDTESVGSFDNNSLATRHQTAAVVASAWITSAYDKTIEK